MKHKKKSHKPITEKAKKHKAEPPIRQFNLLYTFKTFVRGKGNEFAYASAMQAAQNPGTKCNPLYICGGVGLGKTHLLQSIGRFILDKHPGLSVLCLSSDQFVTRMISHMQKGQMEKFRKTFRNLDVLLIDDIQFIAGKPATQEELLHTFNELFQAGKQIVLTSDHLPKGIKKLEDRLKSRFASGLIVNIQAPDLETKAAIIRTKAKANGYKLPEDVIHFLAEKITSNVFELEGCMARIVSFASLKGVPIDLALAREVLNDLGLLSPEVAMNSRGLVILDKNLFYLEPFLEERNIRVIKSEQGLTDFQIQTLYLCHRILVTDNSKAFVDDASSLDIGIIAAENINFKGGAQLAKLISDAIICHKLWSKRHGYILTLNPDGKHHYRELVD